MTCHPLRFIDCFLCSHASPVWLIHSCFLLSISHLYCRLSKKKKILSNVIICFLLFFFFTHLKPNTDKEKEGEVYSLGRNTRRCKHERMFYANDKHSQFGAVQCLVSLHLCMFIGHITFELHFKCLHVFVQMPR